MSIGRLALIERDIEAMKLANARLVWRSVEEEGLYSGGWSDPLGYEPLAFAMSRTGTLYFRGATQGDGSTQTIFTLPTGYRPPIFTYIPATEQDLAEPGALTAAALLIISSGAVLTGDGVSGAIVFCDGARIVL